MSGSFSASLPVDVSRDRQRCDTGGDVQLSAAVGAVLRAAGDGDVAASGGCGAGRVVHGDVAW